jgi:cell division protein FtsL
MNAASKALAQTLYGSEGMWDVFFSKRLFMIILLGLAVFISGLMVVYNRDLNRRLYIDVQTEQYVQQQSNTEYSQLLLEESTWSSQARIEQIATNQLQMQRPLVKNIVLINL